MTTRQKGQDINHYYSSTGLIIKMNSAQQRRKEDDEEAEEMSRGFIRNLPEGVRNQPVGKALLIHDNIKQIAQVRDILEQFEAAYNPADA